MSSSGIAQTNKWTDDISYDLRFIGPISRSKKQSGEKMLIVYDLLKKTTNS